MGSSTAQDPIVQRVDDVDDQWAIATINGEAGTRTIRVRRHSMFAERPQPTPRPARPETA